MRRFYALILLCLVFSAAYDPLMIFHLMHWHADVHWTAKSLVNQYDGQSVYRISRPVSLAYQADQDEFTSSNTGFELHGVYYRVIRQRYLRDTLQVEFVLDNSRNQFAQSLKLYFTQIAGRLAQSPTGIQGFTFVYTPASSTIYSPISVNSNPAVIYWVDSRSLYWGSIPSPPPKS